MTATLTNPRTYCPQGNIREIFRCKAPRQLIEGPAGCVGGETRLYLPESGEHVRIEDLHKFRIAPVVRTVHGPARAGVPFVKGASALYRITMEDGRSVVVTGHHRMLSPAGWIRADAVSAGQLLAVSEQYRPESTSDTCPSDRQQGAAHWMRRGQDSPGHCSPDFHLDGEPPLCEIAGGQSCPPSQAGAPARIHACSHEDGQCEERECSPACPSAYPLSTPDYWLRPDDVYGVFHSRACTETRGDAQRRQWRDQSTNTSDQPQPCCESERQTWHTCPYEHLIEEVQWGTVCRSEYVRHDIYYDLHVPEYEHYLAEGIWHHNTGKTTADLWWLRLLCEKYPGSRHWIGRETRASMTDSVLVTLEEKVFGPTHPAILNGPDRANRRSYTHGGSSIVVGGLDTPERTFSAEYDTMTVFEAFETNQSKAELLQRALRNNRMGYHVLKFETNPDAPTHYLNRWGESGHVHRILTRHEDNPALYNEATGQWTTYGTQYLSNLDCLTGHRYWRLRKGKWVAAEGVVYEEFDPAHHVIETMPEGWEKWRKYRVIDFGFVDPFVCQWWAVNGECAILYREIYMSGRVVEDHAKQIKELSQGETYAATLADHDREDRETLLKHGVESSPATKIEITAGIDLVKARLRAKPNGRFGFYFLKGATVELDSRLSETHRPQSTLTEFDCYSYKKDPRLGIAKDKPEDKDNHGMDCCRYLATELDLGATPSVLTFSPTQQVVGGVDLFDGAHWTEVNL